MELTISLAQPDEALLPEIADALEKRVELSSRAKFPKLWAIIDRLNAHSEKSPRKRRIRRIYRGGMASVLWVLSLILLLPAYFAPQELGDLIPLGIVCIVLAEVLLNCILPKVIGILNLLTGGVILFGAVAASQSLGRLLPMGILLLCFAPVGLVPRGRRRRRFEKQAAAIYRQWCAVVHLVDASVTVSEDGITLSPKNDRQLISRESIGEVYETESLLLPVLDNRMFLLQIKSLSQEERKELRNLFGNTVISVKKEEERL